MTNDQTAGGDAALTLDIDRLNLDEMDYFAETMGFEIEDLETVDGRFTLPEGVAMRTLMRCFATMAYMREHPDGDPAEAGKLELDEIMAIFGEEVDTRPPPVPAEAATPG